MAEGGITLLSMAASDAEDPQTLRMVAGAIANLCGNGTTPSFLAIHVGIFLCFLVIHVAKIYNLNIFLITIK